MAAMEKVVNAGTAARARVPGVRVAGKTGTAQNPHGNDHALFIAFAPVDAPRIALAVVVENGGHGSDAAAPVAGYAFQQYLMGDQPNGPAFIANPKVVAAPKPPPAPVPTPADSTDAD
jgi:penicillin-binding protein 2